MAKNRRRFVVASGLTVLSLAAGCTGGSEEVAGGDHNDGGGSTEVSPSPTPEPTNTPTMTPEPTTTEGGSGGPNVRIEASELDTEEKEYSTEAFVLATIVNDGDGVSGEVRVKARFYDEGGNLLDDTAGSLPYLQPGETWEVYLPFLDDASKVDSHKIDGKYQEEAPDLDPDGVSIEDASLQTGEYDAVVTGTVVNDYEETIDYLGANARFWSGDVILSAGLDNQTDVPAGEDWAFESSYTGYGERWTEADDFDVVPEVSIY